MVSDNEHPSAVPINLLCFRCNGHLTVEKDIRNSFQNTQLNWTFQEFENLQEDILEPNKVLNVVKSCSMKDAILTEINLISAMINSLHAHTTTNSNKEPLWTEVVKRKKKITPSQHCGPCNIPVINNRHNLLPTSTKCKDSRTTSLSVVQRKSVTKIPNKKRNKIIILGYSHARGCTSEVQHNLDQTVEIQGTVKPGANLEEIVTPPTNTTTKLTKKDVVVKCGGTWDIGRNEVKNAIQQISNFVQNHNQTNVIVMSAPHRYDLRLGFMYQ